MSNKILIVKKTIDNLSPSAQMVYKALQLNEKMHVGDIESITPLSSRTIRYALRQLTDVRLIIQVPDMMDIRRHYYAINS
ncbi:MAG: MarR family transcriptional regulator [Candidatus Hodarchaeales archaeon]|jgi:thiosulfate/3-mercaptopyruvate sulfurtransferase